MIRPQQLWTQMHGRHRAHHAHATPPTRTAAPSSRPTAAGSPSWPTPAAPRLGGAGGADSLAQLPYRSRRATRPSAQRRRHLRGARSRAARRARSPTWKGSESRPRLVARRPPARVRGARRPHDVRAAVRGRRRAAVSRATCSATCRYEPDGIEWLPGGALQFTASVGGRTAVLPRRRHAARRAPTRGARRPAPHQRLSSTTRRGRTWPSWPPASTRPPSCSSPTPTARNERQLTTLQRRAQRRDRVDATPSASPTSASAASRSRAGS